MSPTGTTDRNALGRPPQIPKQGGSYRGIRPVLSRNRASIVRRQAWVSVFGPELTSDSGFQADRASDKPAPGRDLRETGTRSGSRPGLADQHRVADRRSQQQGPTQPAVVLRPE